MKLLNHIYQDNNLLNTFIVENKIPNNDSVLIQLFYSNIESKKVSQITSQLSSTLPDSSLIGASTAGVVSDGNLLEDEITISFSIFESSTTKSTSYSAVSLDEIITDLSQNIITSDTKLLILFANTFQFSSTEFLNTLTKQFPKLMIAGGNAADHLELQNCEVFSNDGRYSDLVVAAVDSQTLNVGTKYLLNYKCVGQGMIVTKAHDNVIYEINNTKVLDIYRNYLGNDIADDILKTGTEFPLLFHVDGVHVARAPIAVNEDGSLVLAGNIENGQEVHFGYADVNSIEEYNRHNLLNENKYEKEAIYIYTCSARKAMLGNFLNDELSIINTIAPTTGFVTYGEFFHDSQSCSNTLLNITTTYVTLNENESKKEIVQKDITSKKSPKDATLKALTTLITKTSAQLNENINYLNQFKNVVDEASIISVTNKKGIITHVNDNFINLSGYTKKELIGQPHNMIRHKEMPKEIFKGLWETIKNKKIWKGTIRNRNKDGSTYTVVSEIAPIYYLDGSFREYIGIRTDVTELEEYKHLLKDELDLTHKTLDENINYANQYEEAINSMSYIIKTDVNNIITFVNQDFCEVSGYSSNELIGLNCSILRDSYHAKLNHCKKINERVLAKEKVKTIFTNRTKSGDSYTVSTLFFPVLDKDSNVIEILQVMHDISEIVALNEDIIGTQREVVFTMGAIGETRSKETGLHVKRVAEYSYLIATLYGLSEEEASLLKQASPMHDIGKVGIADNILNKPGKLTEDEFQIMKGHAELGYEMLKHSSRPILNASAVVAHTHHEKWDGSGYPKGLKAHNIPIFGRITAIADVFDALGHDRVYKKAWPLEDILDLFKREKAKHFDPKIVDLFLENLDKFLEIRDSMQDKF